MSADLFRVAVPVDDLEKAGAFWSGLLELRIDVASPGRHYLHTGSAILALVDTGSHRHAHGLPPGGFRSNPELVYLAVGDLDAAWERAGALGMRPLEDDDVGEGIQTRPWGERSFYGRDPAGNPLCLVDAATCFRGSPPS